MIDRVTIENLEFGTSTLFSAQALEAHKQEIEERYGPCKYYGDSRGVICIDNDDYKQAKAKHIEGMQSLYDTGKRYKGD